LVQHADTGKLTIEDLPLTIEETAISTQHSATENVGDGIPGTVAVNMRG
jgi:hypothetical protein